MGDFSTFQSRKVKYHKMPQLGKTTSSSWVGEQGSVLGGSAPWDEVLRVGRWGSQLRRTALLGTGPVWSKARPRGRFVRSGSEGRWPGAVRNQLRQPHCGPWGGEEITQSPRSTTAIRLPLPREWKSSRPEQLSGALGPGQGQDSGR